MGLNLVDNCIFIIYAIKCRDRLLAQLMIFGVALGFTELLADAWLVDVTRTLDYSVGGGPIIWRSSIWMPFAWEVVAVQFAVLGGWLVQRLKATGIVFAGIIGALNIPFYEEMALKTHWWAYRDCKMFLHTPYYVILGEFLIVVVLGWLTQYVRITTLKKSVIFGVVGGALIFSCYALGYFAFEGYRFLSVM